MLRSDRDEEIRIEETKPKTEESTNLTPEEVEAIKKAVEESDARYRQTYRRNNRYKTGSNKVGKLPKALALVYLIALAAFAGNVTTLDVLPVKHLSLVIAGVTAVSALVLTGMCKGNMKKWVRIIAGFLCVVLVVAYSLGSFYIFKTQNFLESTTEESEKKVESLAYEPFNVMITGIDVSGTIDEQGRSDVNMLVTVNPNTSQVLMTSIPRDYLIYMPDKDYEMDKLTHTGFYGVNTTMQAEEELLSTSINYYVKVNFTTVVKFIDAIGGVDVYSEYTFSPRYTPYTFYEGMNHLNGDQALAFARDRKSFTEGDNQRIKNQQAVVEAVIKKATSSTAMLLKYNDIVSSLKDYFKMSISQAEIKALIKMQISDNPKWEIYKYSLTGVGDMLPTYTSPSENLYVMTQNKKSVSKARELISGMISGGKLKKGENGEPALEASDSTGE